MKWLKSLRIVYGICMLAIAAFLILMPRTIIANGQNDTGISIYIKSPKPYSPILDNVIYSDTVEINGTAHSDSKLVSVVVSINNGPFMLCNGTENWRIVLHNLEGEITIVARATDINGRSAEDSITIKVSLPDTVPPPQITGLQVYVGEVSGEVRLTWSKWEYYDYENNTELVGGDRYAIRVYISEKKPTTLDDMELYEKYIGLDDWEVKSEHLPYLYEFTASGLKNGKEYWFAVTAIDKFGNENRTLVEGQNLISAVPRSPPKINEVCLTYLLPILLVFMGFIVIIILAPGKRMKELRNRLKDPLRPYIYVAPALIALLTLTFYPVAYGFYISFTNMEAGNLYNYTIVGFENYAKILLSGDSEFLHVLWTTIRWTIVNVVVTMAIGLGLALILNSKKIKGKVIYRTLLLLPWAMPAYISCLIWRGMFNYEFGAVNHIIRLFGGVPVPWLSEMPYAFWACVITNIWLGVPFMVMVFSGGLQSIPEDLYEASRVDGLSKWQQFRYITLPLLKPTMVPAFLLSFIWTFNMFNVIYLVTGGGPGGQTDILITYVYKAAFVDRYYAFAAAYSVIIFFLLLSFSMVYTRLSKGAKEVH